MDRLPDALLVDPIAECTFEVRFRSDVRSAGELLPGMFFPALKDQFPHLSQLPASQLPKAMRSSDPTLSYVPLHVLDGTAKRVLLGERVVALSVLRPYPGWGEFKRLAMKVADQLRQTGFVQAVERISLRYTNLIDLHGDADLSDFKVKLELGGFETRKTGWSIQVEVDRGNCVSVVQIATGVRFAITTAVGSSAQSGVMFVVDTVRVADLDNFLSDPSPTLDAVHQVEKEVFFGILTGPAIAAMQPVWTKP